MGAYPEERQMRTLIVVVFLLVVGPAFAAESGSETKPDQPEVAAELAKAARLDALFAELQVAATVAEGKAVERRIWLEWTRSGDPEIDRLMNAALLAMDIRAFSAAIAVLDKIVTQKPDFAEGWNKRATVYYYANEYGRSLADIERTLALEPRHFGALAGLGMIMQDTGDIPRAIKAFEQAVAVNPTLTNLRQAIEQLNARIGKDI
jgi:tetratricopeptide (TPR) repeat protein